MLFFVVKRRVSSRLSHSASLLNISVISSCMVWGVTFRFLAFLEYSIKAPIKAVTKAQTPLKELRAASSVIASNSGADKERFILLRLLIGYNIKVVLSYFLARYVKESAYLGLIFRVS